MSESTSDDVHEGLGTYTNSRNIHTFRDGFQLLAPMMSAKVLDFSYSPDNIIELKYSHNDRKG